MIKTKIYVNDKLIYESYGILKIKMTQNIIMIGEHSSVVKFDDIISIEQEVTSGRSYA